MTVNDAKFEQWLQEALATDVQPSDDFTSRVMERVAAAPQEPLRTNGADKRKLRRMLTTLAACAAIVILIPFGMLMMPKGAEKAPADDCAVAESYIADDAADMEMEYATNDAARLEDGGEAIEEPADGAEEQYTQYTDATTGAPAEGADAKEKDDALTETGIFFSGEEAQLVRAALTEQNIGSFEEMDGCLLCHLTAEETAQIRELLPDLIEAEGAVCLTLEVAQ